MTNSTNSLTRAKHSAVGRTDIGKVRRANEDNLVISDDMRLVVVCDGMGGAKGGAVASATAVEIFAQTYKTNPPAELQGWLTVVGTSANEAVYKTANEDPALQGMGTTFVAALLNADADELHIAHAGDSRIYLLRNGTLLRLTRDHSLVQQLLNAGLIDEQEAATHPHRNVITRCIGADDDIVIDAAIIECEPNDLFLFCSDGLMLLDDARIKRILSTSGRTQSELVDDLIDAANALGGFDNITVALLQISA